MVNGDEPLQNLREWTKLFGLRIVRMFVALPKTEEARVLGKQVLRSGTSVGANYSWRRSGIGDRRSWIADGRSPPQGGAARSEPSLVGRDPARSAQTPREGDKANDWDLVSSSLYPVVAAARSEPSLVGRDPARSAHFTFFRRRLREGMNHKEHREHKGFKARPHSLRSLCSLRLKNLFKIKNEQNSRKLVSRLDRHERAIPGRARSGPVRPDSPRGR
jgi:hypothetical protein